MKKFILNPASTSDFLKILESLLSYETQIPFHTGCSAEEFDEYEADGAPQIMVECDESQIPHINGSFDYFEA